MAVNSFLYSHRVVSIYFCVVLVGGFFTTVLRIDPAVGRLDENRVRADAPSIRLDNIQGSIAELDRYVADNFGMRRFLIRSYSVFRHFSMNAYSGQNAILEWLGVDEVDAELAR